jgi:hypothetical protein
MRIERQNVHQGENGSEHTEGYRWQELQMGVRARGGGRAVMTLVALLSGLSACTTTTKVTDGPDDPLNFSPGDSNMDCIYDYSPGGSTADPDFTFRPGGGGIVVTAVFATATTFQGPPNSMQITYGNPTSIFDSGQIALFPPGPGVTVNQGTTTWMMSRVAVDSSGAPDGSQVALPYGGTWSFNFSCGAVPSCCANTITVDVSADGIR